MAIPTRAQAEAILASYRLPEGVLRHARGVARVAEEAARIVDAAGVPVDVELVATAALLHDIDKLETRGDGGEHGLVAAQWLAEMGHEELAPLVASHTVTSLLDEERFPRGWPSVIVSVADRHVAQEFMTIDERIDDQARRYPQFAASLALARRPAHALEREMAEVIGLPVEELVARLRNAWEAGT